VEEPGEVEVVEVVHREKGKTVEISDKPGGGPQESGRGFPEQGGQMPTPPEGN